MTIGVKDDNSYSKQEKLQHPQVQVKLLEVPLVCLESLAQPQQAGRLRASLHTAQDMHMFIKELQNYYY